MVTLDGVMQAPGGPDEDTSSGFEYGGWVAPYGDGVFDKILDVQMQPAEYLFGRKTFDIFERYWPLHTAIWPGVNEGAKYVMSTTKDTSDWKHTTLLRTVDDIKKLKSSDGPDLQVWGSGKLVQTLLKHDLVDEIWLKIYPLTLGTGHRLFEEGTMPAAFTLTESVATPSGVLIANYKRAGEVMTGTVGE